MGKNTRIIRYDFRGAMGLPAQSAPDSGPWVKKDTSSGGSPTVGGASGGGLALTLDSTNEAQNLCVYFGDVLSFDIDDIIRATFLAKLTAAFPAACSAVIGLGSARHDTLDSVGEHAWFRLDGDNNLKVETDDGTRDNDDVATGQTLSTSFKRLVIDFTTGVQSATPPALAKGSKSNVQFFASDAKGYLRRIAQNTSFDLSGYSGNVQPIIQLQKTAAASVATLTLLEVELELKMPA